MGCKWMSPVLQRAGFVCVMLLLPLASGAATVTIELDNAAGVTLVGAIQRWDSDGNHRKLPDPKAAIDAPQVDASAVNEGAGRWVFKSLPAGEYDLVIVADGRRRFEGFSYVPVREFDSYLPSDSSVEEEAREFIVGDIKKSSHFENIVEPLYLGQYEKVTRVLVMLVRDKPTTYEDVKDAATIRHEIWEYRWRYGAWQKEKRTKVFDRVLLNRDELHRWTWLWDAKLGGIHVSDASLDLKYDLSKATDGKQLKGLYPR